MPLNPRHVCFAWLTDLTFKVHDCTRRLFFCGFARSDTEEHLPSSPPPSLPPSSISFLSAFNTSCFSHRFYLSYADAFSEPWLFFHEETRPHSQLYQQPHSPSLWIIIYIITITGFQCNTSTCFITGVNGALETQPPSSWAAITWINKCNLPPVTLHGLWWDINSTAAELFGHRAL